VRSHNQLTTCSIPDCKRGVAHRGWCRLHYRRWLKRLRTVEAICSIPDCDGEVEARGWCKKHHHRWLARGTTDDPKPSPPPQCSIDGCSRRAEKRGLCREDYIRWREAAKVGPPSPLTSDTRDRSENDDEDSEQLIELGPDFWARVQKVGACWLWTGTLALGYARYWTGTKYVPAHHLAP
jgi:hypothetical protein